MKRSTYILDIVCDWIDVVVEEAPKVMLLTNTVYVVVAQFLLYFAAAIPLNHLRAHTLAIRQFYNLPLQQVGGFTLEGSVRRQYETIVCCVITTICLCILAVGSIGGINVTNTPGDTQYLRVGGLAIEAATILVLALYIFYNERIVYRQIARRTSILYLTGRHPSITYHNADVFCTHHSLDVFPVKVFEHMYYHKPTLTLYDLEKMLTDTRPHIDFMAEVKDTQAHLRCLQPPYNVSD